MKQCSWCGHYFSPTVSYQIYCSTNCRELATREKIADKHKENRRKKRRDKVRTCSNKCGTVLSSYNSSSYCERCAIDNKKVNKTIKEIRMYFHEYEDNTEE